MLFPFRKARSCILTYLGSTSQFFFSLLILAKKSPNTFSRYSCPIRKLYFSNDLEKIDDPRNNVLNTLLCEDCCCVLELETA